MPSVTFSWAAFYYACPNKNAAAAAAATAAAAAADGDDDEDGDGMISREEWGGREGDLR